MTHSGDWREAYKERLCSVEEAMALIGDGDLVTMGVLTPAQLASALADRAAQLESMHVRALSPTEPRLFSPGQKRRAGVRAVHRRTAAGGTRRQDRNLPAEHVHAGYEGV